MQLGNTPLLIFLHKAVDTTSENGPFWYDYPADSPEDPLEAVDAYLKVFEKLLILKYYGMPLQAIVKVLGHSKKLVEEHMELADKHFPDSESLKRYLEERGV